MTMTQRLKKASAAAFTLLAAFPVFAQTAPAPDGTKLGDWIALDNKLSFNKLQKDLPGGTSASSQPVPGAISSNAATAPAAASAPKPDAPKVAPPVMTALYGMTSSEGDQFRGLLQWGDRVYAIRVGGYVKQLRVKKISEKGAVLVSSTGHETFVPLDVDYGEIATPVSRSQPNQATYASSQPMGVPVAQPVFPVTPSPIVVVPSSTNAVSSATPR